MGFYRYGGGLYRVSQLLRRLKGRISSQLGGQPAEAEAEAEAEQMLICILADEPLRLPLWLTCQSI